jgi:hypothetical protein
MTKFVNKVNAFGNSAGDDLEKHVTSWRGAGTSFPKGKLKRYPGAVGDISGGNRRLAKAQHGDGGGSATSFCGKNAFTKGGKGK